MSVKFKKLAIASAVGATLGMAGVAQASNSLLFPYVNSASTAFTFLTVFDDPYATTVAAPTFSGVKADGAIQLHMYYGTKPVAANRDVPCDHTDFFVNVSDGNLLQWEASNRFNLPMDFADKYGSELVGNAALELNREGFLIVQRTTPAAAADGTQGQIHGEAIVVDTASGLALSYTAQNVIGAPGADPETQTFATTPANADAHFATSWYPTAIIGTSWYVLPVGTRVAMTPDSGGGIKALVMANTNASNRGAFARSEAYFSGLKEVNFTCFTHVTTGDLLSRSLSGGGWMSIVTAGQATAWTNGLPATPQPSRIWKLQDSRALGNPINVLNEVEMRRPLL